MHINLNNLTGIKKSLFNYEVGNLFRLVSKNSYPRLGSDFKFIDQDDESKPFEPYYKKNILPLLIDNLEIVIAAHGNSLRALVMELDKLSPEEVVKLEIPTGMPICYQVNKLGEVVAKTIM